MADTEQPPAKPEPHVRAGWGRAIGAVLWCALAGCLYLGVAGALFGGAYAASLLRNAAVYGAINGISAGVACGLVAGAVYGASGGAAGAVLAGVCGGLANPLLGRQPSAMTAGLNSPVGIYSAFMEQGLPFLCCWVFGWLFWRAATEDSRLPMLSWASRFQAAALARVPLTLRIALALLLGAALTLALRHTRPALLF